MGLAVRRKPSRNSIFSDQFMPHIANLENFGIRPTRKADIECIYAIRRHPLVAKMQVPISRHDTPENLAMLIANPNVDDYCQAFSTSLTISDLVIGHISHTQYSANGIAYCGWDLHPNFWGYGYMTKALKRMFCEMFRDRGMNQIIAECFSRNERCIRLLQKLGFDEVSIRLEDRIASIWTTRWFSWDKRFVLHAEQFENSFPGIFEAETDIQSKNLVDH